MNKVKLGHFNKNSVLQSDVYSYYPSKESEPKKGPVAKAKFNKQQSRISCSFQGSREDANLNPHTCK